PPPRHPGPPPNPPHANKIPPRPPHPLRPDAQNRPKPPHPRIPNRKLRRVHPNRQTPRPRRDVIPRQRPLPPLIQPARKIQRQRTSRNHLASSQCLKCLSSYHSSAFSSGAHINAEAQRR